MKKVLLYNIMDDEAAVIKEWIKTHPDVGPQALVFSTTLINSIYYNIYNYRSFETEY